MKIINQVNDWKREIHCDYKNHDFECDCDFEVEFGDLIKESSKTKLSEDCIEFIGHFIFSMSFVQIAVIRYEFSTYQSNYFLIKCLISPD